MGQNWDIFSERFRRDTELQQVKATPRRVSLPKTPAEKARLDAEVADRFDQLIVEIPPKDPKLSRVEKAMRRNAPDLAGAPEEEVRAAQDRRTAHLRAKWPRPRLAALILINMIAWLHPYGTIRLFVCMLILFLVASVAIGPERARDGSYFLWRRFLRLWKVELTLAHRSLCDLTQRLASRSNSAL